MSVYRQTHFEMMGEQVPSSSLSLCSSSSICKEEHTKSSQELGRT